MVLPCTGVILTEADLREVNRAVYKARAKWSPLGTELGVRQDVIACLSVRDPPDSNLAAVLRPWLNDPDLKPCWGNLVTALREITVDEKILANEIIKNHLGMLHGIIKAVISVHYSLQVIVRYSSPRLPKSMSP